MNLGRLHEVVSVVWWAAGSGSVWAGIAGEGGEVTCSGG